MSKTQTKQIDPWKVVSVLCGRKSKISEPLNRIMNQFDSTVVVVTPATALSLFFKEHFSPPTDVTAFANHHFQTVDSSQA